LLGDGEAKTYVVGDAGDQNPLAGEIDVHGCDS
jgi:hypothetical protein